MFPVKRMQEKNELRITSISVPFRQVFNLAAQVFIAWLLLSALVFALAFAIWQSGADERELKRIHEEVQRLR